MTSQILCSFDIFKANMFFFFKLSYSGSSVYALEIKTEQATDNINVPYESTPRFAYI